MLALLFLLAGLAVAHLPQRGERVTVCALDARRRAETITMDGAAAIDYVRMMPGTCWGACPCPARESGACALVLRRDPPALFALTNSTTVVETRVRWDGGVSEDPVVPLEGSAPSDAVLEVHDARFGACRAELQSCDPQWNGAPCPHELGVVRCLENGLECVTPLAVRALPCSDDARLGQSCSHQAGTCLEEGSYVCVDGEVVCDAREPILETCEALRYECGVYMGPCGEMLECGRCAPGRRCYEGHCF